MRHALITHQSYDVSVHVYTYTKGRLTFLRYSASASLAGVSGCSVMRWSSQWRRRLCIVVLHSSVLVLVYSSMMLIFLGQCVPRIFLGCLLWKVLTVFSSFLVRVHSSLL